MTVTSQGPGDEEEKTFKNSGEAFQADVDSLYGTEGVDVEQEDEDTENDNQAED